MIHFEIPGQPVPFARAGAQGKRRFTPKKQGDFMRAVRAIAAVAMRGAPPLGAPVSMTVEAAYLIPASWSKAKRRAALWKSSKPDASNVLKLLEDAMSGIVFVDDAQIAHLVVSKQYGPISYVRVWVEAL